jgi:hypothetical protein
LVLIFSVIKYVPNSYMNYYLFIFIFIFFIFFYAVFLFL